MRLLEEEQRASAAEIRRSIVAGAVLTGRVTSVREFGAFVDLGGGVQGLLHVSEMGWSRVPDASQVVTPGEEITVKVLRVDEDTQKIALGLKQLTADPWSRVQATYEVGQVRTGRVTRLAEFGAFVELEPGVEGAGARLHVRADGAIGAVVPIRRPRDDRGLRDPEHRSREEADRRRAGAGGLREGRGAAPSQAEIVPGARLTGKVERHEKFGVFVFLAPGRTGLIPTSETGVAREADVARAFPVGADVEVVVLEVDPSGRRIRLSRKAVLDAQEAEELREYTDSAGRRAGGGVRIARRQAPRRAQAAGEVTSPGDRVIHAHGSQVCGPDTRLRRRANNPGSTYSNSQPRHASPVTSTSHRMRGRPRRNSARSTSTPAAALRLTP